MFVGILIGRFIIGLVSYNLFEENEDGLDLLLLILAGFLGPITILIWYIGKKF